MRLSTLNILHHPGCNKSLAKLISYLISPIDAKGSFLTTLRTADSKESCSEIFLSSNVFDGFGLDAGFASETVRLVIAALFFLFPREVPYHQNHHVHLQEKRMLSKHYQTQAVHKFR